MESKTNEASSLAVATGSLSESEMAEFAAKVANDIHEGIDRKETRAQLRDVVSWWSMQNCVAHSELSLRKTDLLTGRLAVQLLLRLIKRSRSKSAKTARAVADVFLQANVQSEPRPGDGPTKQSQSTKNNGL